MMLSFCLNAQHRTYFSHIVSRHSPYPTKIKIYRKAVLILLIASATFGLDFVRGREVLPQFHGQCHIRLPPNKISQT